MGGAYLPDWSPDGTEVAFAANWGSVFATEIYVIPSEGGQIERLTSAGQGYGGSLRPKWSPDGRRLAVQTFREVYPYSWRELYIIDRRAGGARDLLASHGRERVLIHTWSPDGTRIAYALEVSVEPAIYELRVVHVESRESSLLVRADRMLIGPSWCPTREEIAYTYGAQGRGAIWSIPAMGGQHAPLHDGPGDNSQPAWSPDGERIAFASNRSGTLDIWVMDRNGEGARQLTSDPGSEITPCWAPDGKAIAYTDWGRDAPGPDIWILEVD